MESHQLGAAQRAGKAEQQQRTVAAAAGALIAGGNQLAQLDERQRVRSAPCIDTGRQDAVRCDDRLRRDAGIGHAAENRAQRPG